MIQTILGKKLGQTQGFLEDGRRIPMTKIDVSGIVVSQVKTKDHEGYDAIQLGYGMNKKADKPTQGHAKKAGLNSTPRFFKESKVDKVEDVELGSPVNVEEILGAGDIVDVSGTSKGKGFAGGVKRHHFKGGPKTHDQSDRHRAPGSIGQSTTPGRVYKGKRMAGRMGSDQVTVANLSVVEVDAEAKKLYVLGLIPGHKNALVTITRTGELKNFVPLLESEEKKAVREKAEAEAKAAEEAAVAKAQEEAAKEEEVKEEPKAEEAPTEKKEEQIS